MSTLNPVKDASWLPIHYYCVATTPDNSQASARLLARMHQHPLLTHPLQNSAQCYIDLRAYTAPVSTRQQAEAAGPHRDAAAMATVPATLPTQHAGAAGASQGHRRSSHRARHAAQAARKSSRASKGHRRNGHCAHHAAQDQHLRGARHHRVLQCAVLLGLRAPRVESATPALTLLSEGASYSCKLTSRPRQPLSTL